MSIIGKLLGKTGNALMAIGRFANSPIGKLLIFAAVTWLTAGGGAALLGRGLTSLVGSARMAGLMSSFGNVASKFLGPIQSLISRSGVGTVYQFARKALSPGELFSMAKSLFTARKRIPVPVRNPAAEAVARYNMQQAFAHRQAQMIRAGAYAHR